MREHAARFDRFAGLEAQATEYRASWKDLSRLVERMNALLEYLSAHCCHGQSCEPARSPIRVVGVATEP